MSFSPQSVSHPVLVFLFIFILLLKGIFSSSLLLHHKTKPFQSFIYRITNHYYFYNSNSLFLSFSDVLAIIHCIILWFVLLCCTEHVCVCVSVSTAPYVKVYLVAGKKCVAKMKTASARKTLDPLYQQQLIFHERYQGCVLQVQCLLLGLFLSLPGSLAKPDHYFPHVFLPLFILPSFHFPLLSQFLPILLGLLSLPGGFSYLDVCLLFSPSFVLFFPPC